MSLIDELGSAIHLREQYLVQKRGREEGRERVGKGEAERRR